MNTKELRNVAVVGVVAIALMSMSCVPIWKYENVEPRVTDNEEQLQDQETRIADNASAIGDVEGDVQTLRGDLDEISQQLDQLRADFEECECGGMALGLPMYFPYDDAEIREQDMPILDRFAEALQSAHPESVLTVEGFADPDGSAAYNQRLSQRRADAVRDYLVEEAGMDADRVRAIGYGEVQNRQVDPGDAGPDVAIENRRVTFVLDWDGREGTLEEVMEGVGDEG